jgi:hypothetical protein
MREEEKRRRSSRRGKQAKGKEISVSLDISTYRSFGLIRVGRETDGSTRRVAQPR